MKHEVMGTSFGLYIIDVSSMPVNFCKIMNDYANSCVMEVLTQIE